MYKSLEFPVRFKQWLFTKDMKQQQKELNENLNEQVEDVSDRMDG